MTALSSHVVLEALPLDRSRALPVLRLRAVERGRFPGSAMRTAVA
jgi:hypothetical protein